LPSRRPSFTLGIGEKLAGLGLEDGDERAEGHVVAIFGPLFLSEQSLIATPGQIIHAGLQFWVRFQGQEPPSRLRGQAFAEGANKSVESWNSMHRFHVEIIPLRRQGAKEDLRNGNGNPLRLSVFNQRRDLTPKDAVRSVRKTEANKTATWRTRQVSSAMLVLPLSLILGPYLV
jgi:hypothetical protein